MCKSIDVFIPPLVKEQYGRELTIHDTIKRLRSWHKLPNIRDFTGENLPCYSEMPKKPQYRIAGF